MNDNSLRQEVLNMAYDFYGTKPEILWPKYPGNQVLRHSDNNKWYALIMRVTKDKLGLEGIDDIDVLNVKTDPVMSGSFLLEDGIMPGYHMNKNSWLTILLDGTVPIETIKLLLTESYELTKSKNKAKKMLDKNQRK